MGKVWVKTRYDNDMQWDIPHSVNIATAMMAAFQQWDTRPAACSLDICVTKEGQTLLVEMNDAYALGCYGLPALLYARFISARWSELLAREDCYR